jgi:uncharacterized protein (TIGR02598 family)
MHAPPPSSQGTVVPALSIIHGRFTSKRPRRHAGGFSLVEVTLALGVVSFSMMSLLAAMQVGLGVVRDTSAQSGVNSIYTQIRSDLQQLPFAQVDALSGSVRQYSKESVLLQNGKDAYYAVSFEVVAPEVPGSTPTLSDSARMVKATVSYPVAAPTSSQQKSVFSVLIARQNNGS